MNLSKLALLGLSAVASFIAVPVQAFNNFPATPGPVVEYYSPALNHYFLTSDYNEMAGLDAGLAGPWVRTGAAFLAHAIVPVGQCPQPVGCGAVVSRFYGTPGLGPNSHFYTLVPEEVAGLKQPGTGWTLEKQAFQLYKYERLDGGCTGGTIPVYRLYNNRWMFNDSNHRYVTRQAVREKMIALGWIDEGPQMCTLGDAATDLARYITSGDIQVREGESCGRLGTCMLVRGVPVPDTRLPIESPDAQPYRYLTSPYAATPVFGVAGSTVADGYLKSFVMGQMGAPSVYLNTTGRTGDFSNINLVHQLSTEATTPDLRLFPWRRDQEVETEFELQTRVDVTTVSLGSPGSAAYGHPSVEFRDVRSGRSFHFNVVAYGTIPPGGDFAGSDARDGKAIVATSFRASTPFLRSFGPNALRTPPGHYNDLAGSNLAYRVNRDEFTRVLAAARTVDAALSSEPDDYFVDNFSFTNEIFGDGELGVRISVLFISRVSRI